ncbi:MAG: NTP transferase domain-containing protein [Candidatus Jettenia sp.]|nr:MAG: NTP transferase domain-containing protein [Candidatus Jettenia sp.]
MRKTTAIMLAAGKGTRMRSSRPKVLHEVCGTPFLEYVIEVVQEAGFSQIIVVAGDKKESVKDNLKKMSVEIAEQYEQLGTAHAVMSVRHLLPNRTDAIIVLNGDTPLVKPQTLKKLITINTETEADVTLLTACLDKSRGYGRISRDLHGCIKGIIEESEASAEGLKIKEIKAGLFS